MSVIAASAYEWIRALAPVGAAILAVIGAAYVTNGVAHEYEERRRQREFDRATMQELTSLYGAIFATWKAWDTCCRFPEVRGDDDVGWTLLREASEAEGRLEALLVRIAADRKLDDADVAILAGLRQAFKILRTAIREGKPLKATVSKDREYAALKAYAALTATLMTKERRGPVPPGADAARTFQQITSKAYDDSWVDLAIGSGWTSTSSPGPG